MKPCKPVPRGNFVLKFTPKDPTKERLLELSSLENFHSPTEQLAFYLTEGVRRGDKVEIVKAPKYVCGCCGSDL